MVLQASDRNEQAQTGSKNVQPESLLGVYTCLGLGVIMVEAKVIRCMHSMTSAYGWSRMVNAVMQAVKDNKELREAVEEVQPEVVAVSLRLSQSRPVYEAFQAMKEGIFLEQAHRGPAANCRQEPAGIQAGRRRS